MNRKLMAPDQPKTKPESKQGLHFDGWRGLLEDCLRRPRKKSVHGLRVATLRLGAEVEQWLESHPTELALRTAKRWRNQAVKLRHALGDVREIDVHLAKLEGLRNSLVPQDHYQPRSSRQSLRRIEALGRALKQDRRAAAKEFSATLAARHERLLRASRAMESAIRNEEFAEQKRESHNLLTVVARLASDFSSLGTDSLHDFRKRVKKLRYQADLLASADPSLAAIAGVFKRMQDAIGEWHDWEALAKLAHRRFGKRSDDGGLEELLKTMTDTSLEKALTFCARELAHLQRNLPHSRPSGPSIEKIPVRRAQPVPASSFRHSA
jgi:CHAD domain-containing protein